MKRYNNLSNHWKEIFGKRVERIPIDLLYFECPHRKNGRGKGGCIFCYQGSNYSNPTITIEEIVKYIEDFINKRDKKRKKLFLAYFQNYTPTYKNLTMLELALKEVLKVKNIVGISIASRPDTISDKFISILNPIKEKIKLYVEIGVQTANEKSLTFLNRKHTLKDNIKALEKMKQAKIDVILHLILGIPNEGKKEFLKTIELINSFPISGIKFHHLHILKETELYKMYVKKEFTPISFYKYLKILTFFLERISPDIVIHRLFGTAPKSILVAPLWSLKKQKVLEIIDRYLEHKNTYQGKLYTPFI